MRFPIVLPICKATGMALIPLLAHGISYRTSHVHGCTVLSTEGIGARYWVGFADNQEPVPIVENHLFLDSKMRMDEQYIRMFENLPVTRKGNTGIWTFVMMTEEGKVLATSEWGTNYEFDPMFWELLPIC